MSSAFSQTLSGLIIFLLAGEDEIKKYLLAGLSFFIPGLGLAAGKKYILAYALLSAYIAILAAATTTDIIETATGLKFAIVFLFITQLTSMLTGMFLCNISSHRSWSSAALCIALYSISITYTYHYSTHNGKYKIYYVDHESMQPTLTSGDLVIAKKYSDGEILDGNIIIFEDKNRKDFYLIKRVSRKPDFLKDSSITLLYVLGDNPDRSTDSRQFGMIEKNQVRGIAKIVLANLIEKNITLRDLER